MSNEPPDEEAAKELSSPPSKEILSDKELLAVVDAIDYERYENPQLKQSIETVLSIGGTIKMFFIVWMCAYPFLLVVTLLPLWGKHWPTIVLTTVFMLIATFFLALLVAVVFCVRRVLVEVTNVIDRTLDLVGVIVKDVGSIGDVGMIGTIALVFGGVNRNLIVPIVENVIGGYLGFLSWPVLWLYRGVLSRAIDATTKRILLSSRKIQVPTFAQSSLDIAGKTVASGASNVEPVLKSIRPYVVGASRTVSWVVLTPLALLLMVVSGILVGIELSIHFFG